MATGTGFGTNTETTMTRASAAKSKPVETQKANQFSEETEAPTAAGDVAGEATGGWVSAFDEVRAGLSEEEKAIVDAQSHENCSYSYFDGSEKCTAGSTIPAGRSSDRNKQACESSRGGVQIE
jgi:hypothetical protein